MGKQQHNAVEFPVRDASWGVRWWDFRNCHDWIGSAPVRSGGIKKSRKKPPEQQTRDFFGREAALEFVRRLRREIPADELLVQIVSLRRQLLPLSPQDVLLPGDWPMKRRSD